MGLHKFLKIIAIILSLIGVVFFVSILVKGSDAVTATGDGVSGFLSISYVTLIITIAVTLLFSVISVLKNPEILKKTLISLGLFLAVILISYVLSSGEAIEKDGVQIISASGDRWVGAGLIAFYILGATALLLMLQSGIRKLLNRN